MSVQQADAMGMTQQALEDLGSNPSPVDPIGAVDLWLGRAVERSLAAGTDEEVLLWTRRPAALRSSRPGT